MYPDREKALARGKRKDKTFIRVFCGIFISVGIILFAVSIIVGVSDHTSGKRPNRWMPLSSLCAE